MPLSQPGLIRYLARPDSNTTKLSFIRARAESYSKFKLGSANRNTVLLDLKHPKPSPARKITSMLRSWFLVNSVQHEFKQTPDSPHSSCARVQRAQIRPKAQSTAPE